jgi:regulator of sigma E protease
MAVLEYLTDWILPFLLVLSVLVFVHELGHYAVARLSGVRVEVFSIGFGPEIFGLTDRANTRWKFSAVPLGGYVKMFGEHDFDADEEQPLTPEERKVSFHHKSLRARTAIVAAGPLANFAFAIVLLAALFAAVGMPRPLAGVGAIQPDSAAAEAGFEAGDRIVAIEGEEIRWFEDLREIVQRSAGKPLSFEVVRGEDVLTLIASPHPSPAGAGGGAGGGPGGGSVEGDGQVGLLGVQPDMAQVGYETIGPLSAMGAAVDRTIGLTGQILSALWQIITGNRTAEELGGPLRIAQLSGQMAQDGTVNLIFFMAALSINLGLINLFPIPMLDGGHLAFYAAEAVRGRPLDKRIQEYGFRFGLAFVLLLMIFATWNDLMSLNVFDFVQ